MKKRKFAAGGPDDAPERDVLAESNYNLFPKETPSRPTQRPSVAAPSSTERPDEDFGAMNEGPVNAPTKSAAKPANRIVSKKELTDSGLSLRDFLNKEQGLTRRKDPTAGEAKDKAAQRAADLMGDEAPAKPKKYDPTAGEAKDKAAQRAADLMGDETPAKVATPKKSSGSYEDYTKGTGDFAPENYPKAPASTGKDTSGPSNLGRALSALGAGAGVAGTAAALRTGTYAARNAKRIADAINAGKMTDKAANFAPQAARDTGKNYPDTRNMILKRSKSEEKSGAGEASPSKTSSDGMPGEAYAGYKRGGKTQKYAKGGSIDGCAQRGKTRGTMR